MLFVYTASNNNLFFQQLEKSYVEDNDDWALDASTDLKHYNVEMKPQEGLSILQ